MALCLAIEDDVDLEVGKLYRIVTDAKAKAEGFLRVIDESGEDYLYPVSNFHELRLPASIAKKIASAAIA